MAIQQFPSEPKKGHSFTKKLSSPQRATLKGMAHPLKPLVQVGNDGITAGIIAEIAKSLNVHELIKIQLPGSTEATVKKQDTEILISNLPPHVHVVSRIGRTIIIYLEKNPKDEPKIVLAKLGK